MKLRDAADSTAREFLSDTYRKVRELDVTIARNTILDCLFSATEDNFIVKVANHPVFRRDARRVIGRMEPHLVELVNRTVKRANGAPA
jgi:hypothetical protein